MRAIFVVMALAACGRFDFVSRPDAPADAAFADAALRGCVAQAASRGDQTCVRRLDGHVWCWGDNVAGAIGDGSVGGAVLLPTPSLVVDAISIASGEDTVCAIRADLSLACWGDGTTGQIGDGTGLNRTIPTPVPLPAGVAEVAVSQFHTCARLTDGTGFCWGGNSAGELGMAPSAPQLSQVPAPVGDGTQITVGDNFTCKVLANGELDCWGLNTAGELGDGSLASRAVPAAVTIPEPVVHAAGGCHRHACAAGASGNVYCWGENVNEQIGTGAPSASVTPPFQVPGVTGAIEVAVGFGYSCARTSGGEVWCWGQNDVGEVGDGTFVTASVPHRVTLPGSAIQLEAGCATTYAVLADATLVAWGAGDKLGRVDTANQPSPVEVPVPCD